MRFTMDDLATVLIWGGAAQVVVAVILLALSAALPVWHRWQGRRQRMRLLKRLEARGR